MLVYVKDGRIIRIEGDPEHPYNWGLLCSKGLAAAQLVYQPDRWKYPQKRVGKRGEDKWKQISWDEALDTIAEKLLEIKRNYGAEAISISTGTDKGFSYHIPRFANLIGTPNIVETGGAQCFLPALNADRLTYGDSAFIPDYENGPRCMVMWGTQQYINNNLCFGARIIWNKTRGAKLIVVDPRFTYLASRADLWLQVRPATDTALALAWLNVIINEGLYDKEFVDKWTVGFDKLAEHVQEYPPEKVAEITWVPSEIIKQAARMYATTKPAIFQWGNALEQFPNSFDFARSRAFLRAITGNLDVPGGEKIQSPMPGVNKRSPEFQCRDRLAEEMWQKRLGADKYKFLCGKAAANPEAHSPEVFQAMLTGKPYPIKAMLFWGCDGQLFANINEVIEAIKKLDFIVVIDRRNTLASKFADVLLPVSTFLEQDNIFDYLRCGLPWVSLRQKVIEPMGECRQDDEIFFALVKRLGVGDDYPWTTMEEHLDWQLEPHGLTFKQFKESEKGFLEYPVKYRKYEENGFKTPSGKVEIYSSRIEQEGYNSMPTYREPPESPISTPEVAKDYPLILITGAKYPMFFHSDYRQLPWLGEIVKENVVEIHPETASKLGVNDGDPVFVESLRGKVKVKAKFDEGMHPQVVHVYQGWPGEANVNQLTSNKPPYDPAVGTYQLRGLLCRVKKA